METGEIITKSFFSFSTQKMKVLAALLVLCMMIASVSSIGVIVGGGKRKCSGGGGYGGNRGIVIGSGVPQKSG